MGRVDVPMVVVTAAAPGTDGERSGCLVGFSSQASIHPPRYAVWISEKNHTHSVTAAADVLGVHFLAADDVALASLFGEETGDEVDKFAAVAWTPGPGGVPLLDAVPDRFAGRVLHRAPTGDHTVHLLEPIDGTVSVSDGWRQLGFQATRQLDPGHDP